MDSQQEKPGSISAVLWQRWGAVLALALALLSIGLWAMTIVLDRPDEVDLLSPLPAPASAYAAQLTCGAGLTRVVEYLGVEDGFARDNEEPSGLPDNFQHDEVTLSISPHLGEVDGRRDYDEMGRD